MKITGFRPMIVSKDAETIKSLFEDLGFERQHTKSDIEGGRNTNFVMEDAGGNCVHVVSSEVVPQDLMSISINVDDFDEAYEFFTSRGFVNSRGDKVTETSSAVSTHLVSPSGFSITLSQHKK